MILLKFKKVLKNYFMSEWIEVFTQKRFCPLKKNQQSNQGYNHNASL